MRRPLRMAAVTAVAGAAALGLASCDAVNSVTRNSAPVVLTGANLTDLVGEAPGDIVAFSYSSLGGTPTWTQIPVQVDERKVVDFGSQSGLAQPGTTGTVYGTAAIGVTALQYTDPDTFVGADNDPTFDTNDELVFMAEDMGGRLPADEPSRPTGVVAGSGVEVSVTDPRGSAEEPERGWVYLYVSDGTRQPSAGQDYVDYSFNLTSGNYKSTYQRADGPNPETSTVVTPTYQVNFSDRWIEDGWMVTAPGATGVDILDGYKNQFVINSCGRSNATFADAEGAFIANIDGPVRAIRSYVGANSGPLTQRTHIMYRDHQTVTTNLRVHAIPAVMDFLDMSAAAAGMTYRSSTVPGGVTVNGTADSVPAAVPTWESYDGPQGNVMTHTSLATDIAPMSVSQFYRDQTSPPETQCWGDSSLLGAAGPSMGALPNTDPRTAPFNSLALTRTTRFAPPAADPTSIPAAAADWATDLTTPFSVATSPITP